MFRVLPTGVSILLLWATPVVGFSVPCKSKIPEQVVQKQLDALGACNIQEAFEYNSGSNRLVTGPSESFAASLAEPVFRSILGHAESTVLMTSVHDDSDYVCCLVKVVPRKDPLPEDLIQAIADNRRVEGMQSDEDDDAKDEHERKAPPACSLYWWEVSKQFEEDEDEENFDEENFYYLVDSIMPDAEDLELDYMGTTLFAIGDEFDEDDDEDDPSSFFFDSGMGLL